MVERSGFGLPVPIREQSDDKHSVYGISLRYEGACAGSSFRTIFRRMHIIGDCVAEREEFEPQYRFRYGKIDGPIRRVIVLCQIQDVQGS